ALASIRPMLGNVPLGAIAMSTAIATALTLEILRTRLSSIPSFDEVLRDMEWKVVIFYASLFSLVKGLEIGGWIESVATTISGYLMSPLTISYTTIYWTVALLSAVIEHDAIILTTLVTLKQIATEHGIDPWPHLWATAWSGTLGSNATIAGAPALYLSLVLAEKALGRKVMWYEWMKITIPFTIVSLIIHYIISLLVFLTLW
ncbi:MAG: SLC13 family permease, partial [Acidilobaceae archaeon]